MKGVYPKWVIGWVLWTVLSSWIRILDRMWSFLLPQKARVPGFTQLSISTPPSPQTTSLLLSLVYTASWQQTVTGDACPAQCLWDQHVWLYVPSVSSLCDAAAVCWFPCWWTRELLLLFGYYYYFCGCLFLGLWDCMNRLVSQRGGICSTL